MHAMIDPARNTPSKEPSMLPSKVAALGTLLFSPWVAGPVVFVLWIVVLPIIKRASLAIVRRRLAGRAHLAWAEAMLTAIRPAVTILIWVTGLALLMHIMPIG